MDGIIHIAYAGPFLRIRDEDGKQWTFEMHRYFGPAVVHPKTFEHITPPGERSHFWSAFKMWEDGGSIVSDGICVVEKLDVEV